jgi:hypothetical protein
MPISGPARLDNETAMKEEAADAMADDSRSRLGRGLVAPTS